MIEKIIFDLDNTLMMFDEKYITYYQTALKENKYPCTYKDAYNLFESIGKYEEYANTYNEQILIDFINKDLKTNYKIKLIKDLINTIGENWTNPVPQELINTLSQLSKKYELYVLTNFFTKAQQRRLEKVGILAYFKEIVGTDKTLVKPHKEAFTYCIKDTNPNKCIMIGDNIKYDIESAANIGMKTILFDPNNKYNNTNYTKVTNYKEIINIVKEGKYK